MASSLSPISAAIGTLLLTVICIQLAEAQQPECISNLVPCANYLNSTKPPESCCKPLKEAVTHQLQCLCGLYENPALMKSFNINVTQALALPGYCGIPGSVSACKDTSIDDDKALSPGSSPSSSTPATPGTPSGNEKKSNAVEILASTGSSILLMLGAALMLC